jgi:molybdenum cofactor biosynthesis enzyme MoaA
VSAIHSLKLHEKIDATRKYIHNRRHRLPMRASIEMTKHCNAGCDFCDDWKTKHSPKLGDVVDMVRRLNPMVLAITGGEPLLEKKLVQIVRDVKAYQRFIYVYVITNGSLLTEEKATQLFDAGLDQISISLNYLDSRQDEERKLPGLYEHIAELVPKLTAARHNMLANTVIMRENLDQILSMARRTLEWGAKVSFSCYTDFKNGNRSHYFSGDQIDELSHIVARQHHELALLPGAHRALLHEWRHPRLQGGERIRAAHAGWASAPVCRLRALRSLHTVPRHGAHRVHALLVQLSRRGGGFTHLGTRPRALAPHLVRLTLPVRNEPR